MSDDSIKKADTSGTVADVMKTYHSKATARAVDFTKGMTTADRNLASYRPRIDFQELNRQMREKERTDLGFAEVIYQRLMMQIQDFESTLQADEEIAAYLSSFGAQVTVRIEGVSYHNPYLIIFSGTQLGTNDRVRLVQHTSQLNVLFLAAKVEEPRKAHRVGFYPKQED